MKIYRDDRRARLLHFLAGLYVSPGRKNKKPFAVLRFHSMHLLHIFSNCRVYVDGTRRRSFCIYLRLLMLRWLLSSFMLHYSHLILFLSACMLALPLHTSSETLYFNFRGLWNSLHPISVGGRHWRLLSKASSCKINETFRRRLCFKQHPQTDLYIIFFIKKCFGNVFLLCGLKVQVCEEKRRAWIFQTKRFIE